MNPVAWLQRLFTAGRFSKIYFFIAVSIPVAALIYVMFFRLPVMTAVAEELKKTERVTRQLNEEKKNWSKIEVEELEKERADAVKNIPQNYRDIVKWKERLTERLKKSGFQVTAIVGSPGDMGAEGIYLLPVEIKVMPPIRNIPKQEEGLLALLDDVRLSVRRKNWVELASLKVKGSGHGMVSVEMRFDLMVGFKE